MSIIVSDSGGGSFTPHPEGQYPAICVDVVDVGYKDSMYGPKYKIRIVFYCGETMEKTIDGKAEIVPLLASSTFTASLSERGHLLPFLEAWRGVAFTTEERKGFDVEKGVLGAPGYIQIVHATKGDNTYANIKSIMRLPKGMVPPPMPDNYERVCEREGWTGPLPHPDMERSEPAEDTTDYSEDDSDLPF